MTMIIPGFIPSGDIRLGPLFFNSYDLNGVAWVCTEIEGWWDLPEVSIPDDPRPFEQDGSYYTPGRYMPRVMTLTGVLIPPPGLLPGVTEESNSRDLASYARQAMGSALNIARLTTMLEVDEEEPKQAEVQIANKPTFRNSTINGAIEFTIPLKAGDPRKYSQTLTSLSSASSGASGSSVETVEAINLGTYPTGAIMRINGPVVNPTITDIELDSDLSFVITVADGDYLEIDLLNRGVLLNGVTNRRATMLIGSRWFMLQPGTNTLVLDADSMGSGATLEVDFRSAWLY